MGSRQGSEPHLRPASNQSGVAWSISIFRIGHRPIFFVLINSEFILNFVQKCKGDWLREYYPNGSITYVMYCLHSFLLRNVVICFFQSCPILRGQLTIILHIIATMIAKLSMISHSQNGSTTGYQDISQRVWLLKEWMNSKTEPGNLYAWMKGSDFADTPPTNIFTNIWMGYTIGKKLFNQNLPLWFTWTMHQNLKEGEHFFMGADSRQKLLPRMFPDEEISSFLTTISGTRDKLSLKETNM